MRRVDRLLQLFRPKALGKTPDLGQDDRRSFDADACAEEKSGRPSIVGFARVDHRPDSNNSVGFSGTRPGVENRLHADYEMAKLDKGGDTNLGSRNANRYVQLSARREPEALRSLVTSDPQPKTRSGSGAGMSSAPEFSR